MIRLSHAGSVPAAIALILGGIGCKKPEPTETDEPPATTATDEFTCADYDLVEVPFDTSPSTGTLRGDLAADFTVPLVGGGTWSLGESWSGCDATVVVTQQTPILPGDGRSVWKTGVAGLIEASEPNARYLFVPSGVFGDAATAQTDELQANIDAALAELDPSDAVHWRGRLLVSAVEAASIDGWAGELLQTDRAAAGFGIDRTQRIRGLGTMHAWDKPTGDGTFESDLSALAYEVDYYDYLYDFQSELDDALAVERVPVLDGSVRSDPLTVSVALPDAATLATFDQLWVEMRWSCPDPSLSELDGCAPGGQIAHVFWVSPTGERVEAARWATPQQREGRWRVNATYLLPYLLEGGQQDFSIDWAPVGQSEPTALAVDLVFANLGLGRTPVQTLPLWVGGPIRASFNDDRPEVLVTRPADVVYADRYAVASGHGEETLGCAAMCKTQHRLYLDTVVQMLIQGEDAGQPTCPDSVRYGVVPNQEGTWWTIRAGWCAGFDISAGSGAFLTENLPVDQPVSFRYELLVNDRAPEDGSYGTIEMGQWIVFWK